LQQRFAQGGAAKADGSHATGAEFVRHRARRRGLACSSEPRPAATYTLSFTDRRSQRRADQRVALGLSPSGPDIVLLSLPAGAHRNVVLLANLCAQVAINGVRQRDLAECLNIDTSKEYPTPAT
jgi:hypothetical protein